MFQHDFNDVTLDDVTLDAIAFLSEPYLLLLIEINIYIYTPLVANSPEMHRLGNNFKLKFWDKIVFYNQVNILKFHNQYQFGL